VYDCRQCQNEQHAEYDTRRHKRARFSVREIAFVILAALYAERRTQHRTNQLPEGKLDLDVIAACFHGYFSNG
jgi:hypothetical protein